MQLTTKQQEGLKLAVARYKNKEPYTVIAGYAGSGKSTLVKFIIEALEIDPLDVAYCAFTGKAAQVLRSKGNPGALTAHKLLYDFKPRANGTFYKRPKRPGSLGYKLIVVDEVSMLPQEMWDLMLTHRIYILACGDPGQLPAISEGCDVLSHPHIFLDEIMRQAQESEIIRLTMDIREGKIIKPYKGKEINIVRKKDLCDGMFTWADQVICATNKTRNLYNNHFRKMKFGEIPDEPQFGEKLICLKNNWDVLSTNYDALVNGTTATIGTIRSYGWHPLLEEEVRMDLVPDTEEGIFINTLVDWKFLLTGEPTINKETFKYFKGEDVERPNELTYGYVVTCHKAQGSEWPKVLVMEENFPFDPVEHRRWLYTACTRPSEKLTLVLKN